MVIQGRGGKFGRGKGGGSQASGIGGGGEVGVEEQCREFRWGGLGGGEDDGHKKHEEVEG